MTTKISEAKNKIPNISNLAIATVFNAKIGEVENKIPHN